MADTEKKPCGIDGCKKPVGFEVRLGPHDVIQTCQDHARVLSPNGGGVTRLESKAQ